MGFSMGFESIRRDGIRWRVQKSHLDSLESFVELLTSGRVLKDYPNKRLVEGRGFIIKIYRPKSRARNMKARILGTPAEHELKACAGVMERGVPAVPVIAVGVRGSTMGIGRG